MVRCIFADIYFMSEFCKENQRKNMALDHQFSDRHIFVHKKTVSFYRMIVSYATSKIKLAALIKPVDFYFIS